ncbi:MAG TPA: PIN domain-containing protein [Bryobacteraceae bacterium]|nr:PIN domain-containing protein [Bryobacteraceae bacterium]HYW46844.1 PIN domain-containing protein [Bryobacteraceae bacterium]
MTLVDTSIWVDHFRRDNLRLRRLLEDGEVCTHPMILGELACGNLPQRTRTLALLAVLPGVPLLADDLVMETIELRRLWGRGIGWVDAHLLCAAMISRCPLWTLDRSLARLAERVVE